MYDYAVVYVLDWTTPPFLLHWRRLTCDTPLQPSHIHGPPCRSFVVYLGTSVDAQRCLQDTVLAADRGVIHDTLVCAVLSTILGNTDLC
jgi:hypothetical protein